MNLRRLRDPSGKGDYAQLEVQGVAGSLGEVETTSGGEMNVRLLRRIAKVIQEKPEEFDMRFLHGNNNQEKWRADCGTAHCICGWAAVLLEDDDIQSNERGREVFRITTTQSLRLFFVSYWPTKFQSDYLNSETAAGKAKIAAARIEHFIKTKGAE